MLTFQDLQAVGTDENKRMDFVRRAIDTHKSCDDYKIAKMANDYDTRRNTTIMSYRKLLYEITGEAVDDNYSANYKLCSNFFNRFVTQQTQYLLGNGVDWSDPATDEALGDDFDTRLQELAHNALVDKVGFGFWNLDHLEVFRFLGFVPLFDEEDGAMKAGIRFWQIDPTKPLRATLYELDGYTNYIWRTAEPEVLTPKRAYKLKARVSEADGTEIYDEENYPGFPIVPLWGNRAHQSELVGIQDGIDAYDLIKSGFANDVDDASLIYWTINNAGGMDDIDLAKFLNHMKRLKAAVVEEDGATAESHSVEAPYASREALLNRIRADLYDDYMALDTKDIVGGANTATQIKAAYEPLNNKTDMFEYCVLDFLQGILDIAGIDDEPSFTRSMIVNTQEEIQTVLQAAEYVDGEYITRKVLTLLGDGDKADEILERMDMEDMERMSGGEEEEESDELDKLEEDDDIDAQLDELEGSL